MLGQGEKHIFDLEGLFAMQVSVSEVETNIGKYIDPAERRDIHVVNDKQAAKIDKVAAMMSVFGAIPSDADLGKAKEGRLL